MMEKGDWWDLRFPRRSPLWLCLVEEPSPEASPRRACARPHARRGPAPWGPRPRARRTRFVLSRWEIKRWWVGSGVGVCWVACCSRSCRTPWARGASGSSPCAHRGGARRRRRAAMFCAAGWPVSRRVAAAGALTPWQRWARVRVMLYLHVEVLCWFWVLLRSVGAGAVSRAVAEQHSGGSAARRRVRAAPRRLFPFSLFKV